MSKSYILSMDGYLRVEQAREKKGWKAQDFRWYTRANVSLATLRRFRGRRLGVQEDCFGALCKVVGIDDWKAQVETKEAKQVENEFLLFAYEDGVWVGREELISSLVEKLEERCRLLVITGLTGIGKTALAERLLIEQKIVPLRVNFDDEGQSTDFLSFAIQLLEKTGQLIEPQSLNNTELALERLIISLENEKQFIIIDSLEKLLKGNKYDGWNEFKDSDFIKFFHAILSSEKNNSRIILTSQDLPANLESISDKYVGCLHFEALSGLSEKSQLQLFLNIFSKANLEVSLTDCNKNYLYRIGRIYEGHPLALRVIAGEISSKPFYGDIEAYWKKCGNEIREIEQAILQAEAGKSTEGDDNWQLHQLTRSLRKRVRYRVQRTFIRLKEDSYWAYVLLCAASIYRLPVPEEWWLDKLDYWGVSESDRVAAIDILHDRYLLEEVVHDGQCKVRQHNLIRSVSLEHLRTLEE